MTRRWEPKEAAKKTKRDEEWLGNEAAAATTRTRKKIDFDVASTAARRKAEGAKGAWVGRPANREWKTTTRGRIRCEKETAMTTGGGGA